MCPESMPLPRPLSPRLDPALHEALAERDFVLADGAYRRGVLSLVSDGRWLTLHEEPSGPEPVPRFPIGLGGLGQPGLWKWVDHGAPRHRVFEIPAWVLRGEPTDGLLDDGGPAPFGKVVDWALASRFRDVPPGWSPPPADLVTSWIPRGGLTVEARGHVRQGELILNASRWTLRVPILPQVPKDLPPRRTKALHFVVAEAQHRWAMARMGIPSDRTDAPAGTAAANPGAALCAPGALVAEVDFTGAPHSEFLFSAGRDVLRHVVAWLVETVDVLGDADVTIGSLAEDGGNTTNPNERRVP